MEGKKVIFVYNAVSGLLNSLEDYVHKVVSPSTYACNLCGLTFGNTGMKSKWKQFISNLNFSVNFMHKDEFLERYSIKDASFPCAFIESDSELELLISSDEMNGPETLDELKSLVSEKLKQIQA